MSPFASPKFLTGTFFSSWLALSLVGCGANHSIDGGPLIQFGLPTPSPTPTPTRSLCGGQILGIPMTLSGAVTTFAGTAGTTGTTDAIGTAARFDEPYSLTTDGLNLFVSEKDGNQVRKIVISTAEVSTLVPNTAGLREPVGITCDSNFAYVCDSVNNRIMKVQLSNGTLSLVAGGTMGTADGTGAAAQFNDPYGITIVGSDLFVADRRNHTIRKIVIATGEVTTFAGTAGTFGSADGVGTAATFDEPMSITTDCNNNLYVGDWNNFTIRKVTLNNATVTTLAGTVGVPGSTDGVGAAATLYGPRGLCCDGTSLFVADYYSRHGGKPIPAVEPPRSSSLIRKVNLANGAVTTLAGVVDTSGSLDNPVGTLATFREPSGITTDGFSLFVADRQNNTVRQIR